MSLTLQQRSEGRQAPLVARADFKASDLPSVAFVPAIELPADAVILRGTLNCNKVFGAGETIAVGVSGTPAALLAATSVAALGMTSLTAANLGYGEATRAKRTIGLTASAALTLGEGSLIIEYIRKGRGQITQG